MSTTPESQPPRFRWSRRRKRFLLVGLSALALALVLALAALFYVRSGRLNRRIAGEIQTALKEYGVRAEVGGFELGGGIRSATLRDLKLYNQQTGQLLATIDRATVSLEVREPFAFRLRREIVLKQLDFDGLNVWIESDEQGRFNFEGLHNAPPQAPARITFDYSALIGAIHSGKVHLNDRAHKVSGELADLRGNAQPISGSSPPAVRVQLGVGAGQASYEGRETKLESLNLAGRMTASGAEIEQLALRSPLAEATLSGRLDDWQALRYQFQTQAQVKLAEATQVFAPDTSLQGQANFAGRVEGEGARYRITGKLHADELAAAGTRLRAVQADEIRVEPEGEKWHLASQSVRAHTVNTKGIEVQGASISNLRGEVHAGRAQLQASQAHIGRVAVPKGQFTGITLQNINAKLGGGQDEVRGSLSLTGGSFDKAQFGQMRGQLIANPTTIALNGFNAVLLGGSAAGDLAVQIAGSNASRLQANFTGLKTSDIFSLVAVKTAPLVGTVDGRAEVTWPGTDALRLSGNITANFAGQTTQTPDAIPVTGQISTRAQNGVLAFDQLALKTDASTLTATGSLGLSGDSDLRFTLASTRAEELQTIAYSLGPLQEALTTYEPQIFGDFKFTGALTGPLDNPTLTGEVNASSIGLQDEILGSLSGRVLVSPTEIRFENATLRAANGGSVRAVYIGPRESTGTQGKLDATLERMDVEALVKAAGFTLQQKFIAGEVSGEAHLTGLPAAPRGQVNANLISGTIAGQPAELATASVIFDEKSARIERLEARLPQGHLVGNGNLDLQSKNFQFQGRADGLDLARLVETLELANTQVTGMADANFQASGNINDLAQLNVQLTAQGQQVTINGRSAGELRLTAHTNPGGRVDLELVTGIAGNPQPFTASIELREPGHPIEVKTNLADFDIAPIIAAFAPNLASSLAGKVTGTLQVTGPLTDAQGEITFDHLRGSLTLSSLALQLSGSPVTLATPVTIALNGPQITLTSTRITAQGTDLRLGGTLGLRAGAEMNFTLNGTLNLEAFNRPGGNVFAGGSVVIDMRLGGTASDPRFAGEALLQNTSFSALDAPVALENGNGRIVFSGQQAALENFTARATDGTVQASGTLEFAGLQPNKWQVNLSANDVELFYGGVRAMTNSKLVLTGTPQSQTLSGTVTVPSAEYTSNIQFDSLAAGGGGFNFGGFGASAGLSGTPSAFSFPPVNLDIRLEARDTLLIRNEQINTVGSVTIYVGGTFNEPDISGRATLEGGTIKFRGQRYEIVTGTFDLPGGFGGEPTVNLQAEGDVSGYHVYVGFIGPLNDMDVTLRAEPDLARSEILSLIATGRTETGTLNSEDMMRSGLGTAASLLSDEFISQPLGHQAERLLGLNRFQIDPVLRPNANPAARLTLGRQIARNLSLTYSTNLSSEQDQTVIVEYNLTNRFSAIASYTQGGSATQQGANDNDFTIEVRGRKRFSLGAGRGGMLASTDPTAANRAANAPPRPERAPLPKAAVDVNKPQGVKISENRLRDLLPVIREGFSRSLARLGERNLTNYLQEQGYFFAEVRSRCEPVDCSGPDLRVLYDVSPGERYHLARIDITGTEQLGKGDVIGDLQSQEEGLLGGIPFFERLPLIGGTARGLTSNDRLRNDRETIRRRMADLGFRSARVESAQAIKPESNDLVVVFNVEEGPRSVVVDVVVRGNTQVPASDLRAVVPIKEGEAFSPTAVRDGAQQIKNYYAARGYLDAKPELSIVDLDDNRVRLLYSVNEGARAVAQEITVSGNEISRENAIRRFFAFKPGEVITPNLIRTTQRDLYATGAFREVNIRTEALPGNDESARRVAVNVTEAKPLLLVYGLGYSTDDGPRALAQLTHTNLFGRVNSATIKLRGSRREQLGQFQFTDLRPFGHNWPTTFSVFYNRNADLRPFVRQRLVGGKVEDSSSGRSFGIHRFAAFIQTERKLSEQTSLRFRYSFENAKLFNLQNVPDIEVTRNEKATRLGMFSAGISRDTRDSAINPTRGQLISADHSIAARIFGGNEAFNKFFGNYQRYETLPKSFPLLHDSVIAVSARIGLAAAFKVTDRDGDGVITEPEQRLPISERFFAGGATTLRGFRFEEAGPQGILEPRQPNELPTLVPLGGDALTVFNFELRYPLTRRLRLVPFYDLGNVFRRTQDISFGRMTNTIGLGLRINTPLGPVGVDYGYLLDPPSFITASGGVIRQSRGVIHIRFGQSF